MKRTLLFSALVLATSGALADPIDLQKASDIANDYLSGGTTEAVLVKAATRSEARARRLPAKTAAAAPYYIFSRGAGCGFVIVSGDDCLQKVLGYTESGDYNEADMPPAFLAWLESMQDRIEFMQERGENISRQSEARRTQYTKDGVRLAATTRQNIEPLLTCAWHQDWPYNSWAPYRIDSPSSRCVTGCVATAAAQVLYYLRNDMPEEIGASTPTYTCWSQNAKVTQSVTIGTPLKWGLLLDNYNSSHPAEYDDVVGQLMLAVGAYTKMDYSSSSGAHISDLLPTFNDCFNTSSKNLWAGHSTLEKLAYEDLIQGYPMVYAGYDVNNGGHAIVLDGYRASDDKFHFNFGWGGQATGYYVMEDEGVNGYGYNPSMTYNIRPKKINVNTKISAPRGFFASHDNKIKVTVQNKSTFPLQGVYLFCNTSNANPTKLSAADSYIEQVFPNDGSLTDVYLNAKPTNENTYYLIITDERLNVIGRQQIAATKTSSKLLCTGITVCGTDQTETHAGHVFTLVNGLQPVITVQIDNISDVNFQEAARIQLLRSDDNGETFTELGTRSVSGVNIPANGKGELKYSISSSTALPLEANVLYAARLMDPLVTRSETTVEYAETAAQTVYFKLSGTSDLNATLNGNILKFTGTWEAAKYEEICTKRSNSAALVYDLTDVTNIGRISTPKGKDYCIVLAPAGTDVQGVNVINAETMKANQLQLCRGVDFAIPADIEAENVTLQLDATPNQWILVTVPCKFELPYGMFAKRIDKHTSSGITNKTTNVTTLEAGQTYLLMTSSPRINTLKTGHTTVLAAPVENADNALVGTYQSTTAPEQAFYLDNDYFRLSKTEFEVVAFGGYFAPSNVTRDFRSNSTLTLDNAYLEVGQTILAAYDIYDRFSDYTTAEANASLIEQIAEMEKMFTTRSASDSEAHSAVKNLLAFCEEYQRMLNTESVPADFDMTFMIVNPSFERGASTTSTTGSTYGWKAGQGATARLNSNLNYRGVGAVGRYLVYSETGSPAYGSGISQTIQNLPQGVYMLTAMVGVAPGNTATLFANEKETESSGSKSGQYYLAETSVSDIIIREGDELTIGMKDAANPYKVDDFRLYYVRPLTDEETAITETPNVADAIADTAIYDIAGRRLKADASNVNQLPRGIYIIGGKKVLVK